MKDTMLSQPVYESGNLGSLPQFVDSHCHIDFMLKCEGHWGSCSAYRTKHGEVFPSNYEGSITVFCKPLTFEKKWAWERIVEENGVWAAFICRPKSAMDYSMTREKALKEALSHPNTVALGEIGLDYSIGSRCGKERQETVFRKQLRVAVEMDFPIVIHAREAEDDCLEILKQEVPKNQFIHHHCFNSDRKTAKKWLSTFPNLYLGFTGLITFPSVNELHEVVKRVPVDRILLETDAPFFVPKSKEIKNYRWSSPGMAWHVAAKIASLRGDSFPQILEAIRMNTFRMYGC